MDENDKQKAVAIGAALFLFAAAFGFAVAALQYNATDAVNDLNADASSQNRLDEMDRNADMALEIPDGGDRMELLQQASEAMLAQANQAPENVLQLLR